MRKFRNIIESSSAPNIQDLWLCKGDLKYHNNGAWVSLLDKGNTQDTQVLNTKVDTMSKKVTTLTSTQSSYSKDIKTLTDLVNTLNQRVTELENVNNNK